MLGLSVHINMCVKFGESTKIFHQFISIIHFLSKTIKLINSEKQIKVQIKQMLENIVFISEQLLCTWYQEILLLGKQQHSQSERRKQRRPTPHEDMSSPYHH